MKKGQQKSSKRKQKLYDKYLKKRTKQINVNTVNTINLFLNQQRKILKHFTLLN